MSNLDGGVFHGAHDRRNLFRVRRVFVCETVTAAPHAPRRLRGQNLFVWLVDGVKFAGKSEDGHREIVRPIKAVIKSPYLLGLKRAVVPSWYQDKRSNIEIRRRPNSFIKGSPMTAKRSALGCGGRASSIVTLATGFALLGPAQTLAEGQAVVASQSKTGLEENFDYPHFRKDSFWYQPIPRTAPLHEKSDAFSAEFARQVKSYYGYVGINFSEYSAPVYTVGRQTPTVNVAQWDCWKNGFHDTKLEHDMMSVPIPQEATPAGGTDAEMVIFQPATDTMWEFWNMRKDVNGDWQACWGGKMTKVSENSGIWRHPYGAAATGLPFAAGQIRVEELRRGRIDHVIGISLVDAEAGVMSWPANRTDGWNPQRAPNRIPEGARLRIDPSVDLASLKLHPIAYAIAQAGQIYGFVVWDRAGSISLRAENPKRYTVLGLPSPYPKLFGTTASYKIMDRFPWDKMQFLPLDYGSPTRPAGVQ